MRGIRCFLTVLGAVLALHPVSLGGPAGIDSREGLVAAIRLLGSEEPLKKKTLERALGALSTKGPAFRQMQLAAVTAVLSYLVRFNNEECLRHLVRAARDRHASGEVHTQILIVLQLIDKNWGHDILNEKVIASLLQQPGQVRVPMMVPKTISASEVAKQFRSNLRRKRNLPFDPLERLDDPMEQMKRDSRVMDNSLSTEIGMLIEHRVTSAKSDIVRLLDSSNNPLTLAACLKYLRHLFPTEGADYFTKFLTHTPRYPTEVKYEAVQGLLAVGGKDNMDALGQYLLEHPDDHASASIIGGFADNAVRQAERWLIEYAEGERARFKRSAISALGKVGGQKAQEFLLTRAGSESNPYRFRRYARALVDLGSKEVFRLLADRLKNGNRKMVLVSVEVLGLAKNRDAIPELRALLPKAQDDDALKMELLSSLAHLGDKEAKQELLSQFKKLGKPGDRAEVLRTLCFLQGEAVAIVLDSLGQDELSAIPPADVEETLCDRAADIKSDIADYLERKSIRQYHRGVEIAYRCLLRTGPTDEKSLRILKKAYSQFPQADWDTLQRCAPLRKEIALHLANVTGEEYRYTVIRELPFR